MSQRLQTRFVLFDGGCGLCSRTLRMLHHLDVFHKTVPLDIAHDWPTIEKKFPRIDFAAAMRDMHVITSDGQIDRGFDAYRSLAWVLPLAWPILPLLYLPPVRWLGWRIYRRVADNRRACEYNPR
jgi:predicted DCC family thiol-disulfide oxidoreductase YuxK